MTKLSEFDPARYLTDPEQAVAYLEDVAQQYDAALFASALGDVARARGMTTVARDAGMAREALYRALSKDGNPEFATIVRVTRALGLRIRITAA